MGGNNTIKQDDQNQNTNTQHNVVAQAGADTVAALHAKHTIEEIQASLHLEYIGDSSDVFRKAIRKVITNDNMFGAYFIEELYTVENGHFDGIKKAYEILQNQPDAKVILMSFYSDPENYFLNKYASGSTERSIVAWLLATKQCKFIVLPYPFVQANHLFDEKDTTKDNTTMFESEKNISLYHIGYIKHCFQPHKVKDPYHPENESEKAEIQRAFEMTKKYFPGLDTVEKMLDYVLNVKLDIPEVMKGQKIAGVWCDVDGTLIEYEHIGSEKEGTQQLRPEVVKLLKQYEAEGKTITIWTGGDVAMKEAYLRSLGITWPVVSKYDYAGATAEIVIDDTDRGAFVLQSKIMPETYIDTRNMK